MIFVSAFCLEGRLADRLGRSGRNGSEASFPTEKDSRKCRWRRHVMRTCRWNRNLSTCRVVSKCRVACKFSLPTASKQADVARMPAPRSIPLVKRCARSDPLGSADSSPPRRQSVTMQPGASLPAPGFCLFSRSSIAILPSSSVNSSMRNSKEEGSWKSAPVSASSSR